MAFIIDKGLFIPLLCVVTLFFWIYYTWNCNCKSTLSNQIRKQINDEPIQSDECKKLCSYSSILTNYTVKFDTEHIIRHFSNFVCPQNFRNLADWVYAWPNQFHETLEYPLNLRKAVISCLPPGSIIYVRGSALTRFFIAVYPHLRNNFVLITGESDYSSPENTELLEKPDSKIIHWFGQNGQIDASKSKKFTHIPIGINCYQMADAIESVYSQQPYHTVPSVFNDLDEPSSYIQPQDISHRVLETTIPANELVLINFNVRNDRSGLRSRIWEDFCSEKAGLNYTFAKCLSKTSGVQILELPKIYTRNRQYPFWLSPRGGGIDCHRTWEALYLDIIPIVWNNSLNVLYENLPVLIINDYKELNEQFLYKKLNEISKNKLSKEKIYQYEKLRNAYWRRLILEKSRHKQNINIYQRNKLCWAAKSTVKITRY